MKDSILKQDSGLKSTPQMDPHRESCRRQHRIIGHYLAVTAWLRGLDCVVLVRLDLERFLGLKRFKSVRVKWLMEDLKPWFPYQSDYYRSGAPSSIHSLFLSRVSIANHLSNETMKTEARIAQMPPGSPRTERFSHTIKSKEIPSEADMVAFLSVLAAGLRAPKVNRKAKK